MASFLIKRIDQERKMIKLSGEYDGYSFKPNLNSVIIKVDTITLYNQNMIDKILVNKIQKKFERLALIAYDILMTQDEDTSSDAEIELDEIKRLMGVIRNKYEKYISKEIAREYLKKLLILDNELRTKMLINKVYTDYLENDRGHSR